MIFLLKFMTAGADLSVMLKCSAPVFFLSIYYPKYYLYNRYLTAIMYKILP